MSYPVIFTYNFDFDHGRETTYRVQLDRESLQLTGESTAQPPYWTALGYKQCSICPLSSATHSHCPVARNLTHLTERFSDVVSHETVNVSVATEDRTYRKRTTIDEALGSLMGLIMVTSGCPVLDYLRPMARLHLPFATPQETTIRMLSMYLIAQYFQHRDQGDDRISFRLADIEKIYARIGAVNRDFAVRIATAGEKDAHLSALSNLDSNATLVTMTLTDTLNEFKKYYSAYISE